MFSWKAAFHFRQRSSSQHRSDQVDRRCWPLIVRTPHGSRAIVRRSLDQRRSRVRECRQLISLSTDRRGSLTGGYSGRLRHSREAEINELEGGGGRHDVQFWHSVHNGVHRIDSPTRTVLHEACDHIVRG